MNEIVTPPSLEHADALATDETRGMTRAEYMRIKASLPFERHYGVMLANHALDAALLACAFAAYSRGLAGYIVSQALLAVVFFRAFCILHECGHGSAARRRSLNTVSGHIASVFCFMPFFSWKYIHEEHHVWTGHLDKDPTARALARWKTTRHIPGIVRFAWRSWIPLGALVQQLVFWSYPAVLVREHGWSAPRTRNATASVALLIAVYGALLWWLPWRTLAVAVLPAFVLYLVLTELVNLPHHVDRPFGFPERLHLWEQNQTSRSCYYPTGFSEFVMLNFNFHIEHHLFPALPWYRLRGARALVKRTLGNRYAETVGIAWNLEKRRMDMRTVLLDDA